MSLDVSSIREDFPILKRMVNDRPLIYFDNSATSLKPQSVIDAVTSFYTRHCSNIHRGVHALSQEASELFEEARYKIARCAYASISSHDRDSTESERAVRSVGKRTGRTGRDGFRFAITRPRGLGRGAIWSRRSRYPE